MKILLTNPTLHYSHGPKFIQPDWPSLTLPYVAAIMGGHEIRIVDHSYEKRYLLERVIQSFQPDLVAFSVIASKDTDRALAELRKIRCAKIAGGQGASYHAGKFEAEGVWVFPDEAELALPHYLATGQIKPFDRVNLDNSPMPRWDLVERLRSRTYPTYTGAMEMSRGCPFKCAFCVIADFWHSLRTKSNDRIIEELRLLHKLDRRHIYLSDDSFGVNAAKHLDLCEKILSSGMKFWFFTQIRADMIAKNPEMIKMARKAGLSCVLVGFDSYDEEVLKTNTKTTSSEVNTAASMILRENKIAILGSHIYGLPGQKSFERTFRLGRRNSDVFAMPYFDGRPKIAQPGYDPKYVRYVRRDQFSMSSLLGLFHPDPAIRQLKRGALRRFIYCSWGHWRHRKEAK